MWLSSVLYMEEFVTSVNEFLAFGGYDILQGKGKVSRKAAEKSVAILNCGRVNP